MAMSSLKELASDRGMMLPVTQWIEEWRSGDRIITEEAVDTVFAVAKHDYLKNTRSSGQGRMRPSGLSNDCMRSHALAYLGFPQGDRIEDYEQMARAGTMQHYDWQIIGLSAGFITEIEVRLEIPEWQMRGQCDGLLKDGSLLEIKTMGSAKFNGMRGAPSVLTWDQPKREFVLQSHCYMKAKDLEAVSILVANRDSNEYREFRINRDPQVMDWLDEFFTEALSYLGAESLPEMLEGCWYLVNGYDPATPEEVVKEWRSKHRWCNYKDVCPTAQYADGIPF